MNKLEKLDKSIAAIFPEEMEATKEPLFDVVIREVTGNFCYVELKATGMTVEETVDQTLALKKMLKETSMDTVEDIVNAFNGTEVKVSNSTEPDPKPDPNYKNLKCSDKQARAIFAIAKAKNIELVKDTREYTRDEAKNFIDTYGGN